MMNAFVVFMDEHFRKHIAVHRRISLSVWTNLLEDTVIPWFVVSAGRIVTILNSSNYRKHLHSRFSN